jgi:hypothetical protein
MAFPLLNSFTGDALSTDKSGKVFLYPVEHGPDYKAQDNLRNLSYLGFYADIYLLESSLKT